MACGRLQQTPALSIFFNIARGPSRWSPTELSLWFPPLLDVRSRKPARDLSSFFFPAVPWRPQQVEGFAARLNHQSREGRSKRHAPFPAPSLSAFSTLAWMDESDETAARPHWPLDEDTGDGLQSWPFALAEIACSVMIHPCRLGSPLQHRSGLHRLRSTAFPILSTPLGPVPRA